MKLLNPKLQWYNSQKKWFVIDAPEMPDPDKFFWLVESEEYKKAILDYHEALSKAPRWEVKNQETVKILIWKQYYELIDEEGGWRYWNPDPTKLYDLPKGFRIELKIEIHPLSQLDIDGPISSHKETFAILIPEEVKEGLILKKRMSIGFYCIDDTCKMQCNHCKTASSDESEAKETESQYTLINEFINLWRLGANIEGLKSKFTITRNK